MNLVVVEIRGRLSINGRSMEDNLVYGIVFFKGNVVCI